MVGRAVSAGTGGTAKTASVLRFYPSLSPDSAGVNLAYLF